MSMSDLRDEIADVMQARIPEEYDYANSVVSNRYEVADDILALIADALMSEDVFGAMRWAATIEGAVTREGAFGVHVDHQRLVKAALEAAGVVKDQDHEGVRHEDHG